MTLQQYIDALSALPKDWRDAPRDSVPLAQLGDQLFAAKDQSIMAYDPVGRVWKLL